MRAIDAEKLQKELSYMEDSSRELLENGAQPFADGVLSTIFSVYKVIQRQPTVELPHWHDLRKNPEDLPNGDYDCIVEFEDGYMTFGYYGKVNPYTNNRYWLNKSDTLFTTEVVKWCELPKDED